MSIIEPLGQIEGVQLVRPRIYEDDRGRFLEIFRKAWFPELSWERLQSNHSFSTKGVLRGLHYHHKQVDYWYLVEGEIQVGLADLRLKSPTYGQSMALEMKATEHMGVFIPVGVAHGFLALTAASLIYFVDKYYDGDDEYGVAWNDPRLAIPWAVASPILSNRDKNNPLFSNIPAAALPG